MPIHPRFRGTAVDPSLFGLARSGRGARKQKPLLIEWGVHIWRESERGLSKFETEAPPQAAPFAPHQGIKGADNHKNTVEAVEAGNPEVKGALVHGRGAYPGRNCQPGPERDFFGPKLVQRCNGGRPARQPPSI